jgi:hypothetical protein
VVSDLTDAQKKELKVKGGVKVDAVSDAAAKAGLREGDVILAVGNIEVPASRNSNPPWPRPTRARRSACCSAGASGPICPDSTAR